VFTTGSGKYVRRKVNSKLTDQLNEHFMNLYPGPHFKQDRKYLEIVANQFEVSTRQVYKAFWDINEKNKKQTNNIFNVVKSAR